MAKDDVTLNIGVDSDDARKDINNLVKSSTKGLDKIEDAAKDAAKQTSKIGNAAQGAQKAATKSFGGLSKSLIAFGGVAAGALAAVGVAKGISAITEAASVQQDAVNALNNSLKLTGEFSEQASQDIQDFASSIQQSTKFGDEAILQQFALAKAFGASNEQAKLITTAATELAAATGKSLDEATRQVSKTLGGFAGELGEVNSAIKALTQEQLKNGEAAKILIDQYGGSAASQVNTFSGAAAQLGNIFGDLLETLGEVIISNPAVIGAFKGLSTAILALGGFIKENQAAISDVIGSFIKFSVSIIPRVIRSLSFLVKAFKVLFVIEANIRNANLSLIQGFLDFKIVRTVLTGFVRDFRRLQTVVLGSVGAILNVLSLIPGLEDQFSGAINSITESAVDSFNSIGEDVDFDPVIKGIDDVKEAFSPEVIAEGFDAFSEGLENTAKFADGLTESISAAKKEAVEAGKAISSSTTGGGGGTSTTSGSGEGTKKPQEVIVTDSDEKKQNDAAIIKEGTVSAITAGLGEGAGKIAGSVAGFVNQASAVIGAVESVVGVVQKLIDFIPKTLDSITNIFNSLNDLPTKIAQSISNLFGSITNLARNFLANLVRGLGKIIGDAFKFLFKDLPIAITEALKELPGILRSTLASLPNILVDLADGFGPLITDAVEAFVKATPDIAFVLIDTLITKGGIARISFALAKALAFDLPIGLTKGILNALSDLGKTAFENLAVFFSKGIKFPKLDVRAEDFLGKLRSILSPSSPFLEKLQAILDSFNPEKAFQGGGGGFFGQIGGSVGGALGGVGRSLGLASGGTVPPGFPNDNFPATLTSGEEVVNQDTANKLRQFLDNPQPSGPSQVVIQLQVGEQELASVIYDLNRRGFRTA